MHEHIDTTDRPFALPPRELICHVIYLPIPPSVNRIWRASKAGKHKVSLSPEYTAWKKQADKHLLTQGGMRGRKTIYGRFNALVEVHRPNDRSDLDNRIKAVLDYAQQCGLIENDKRLVEITARWADVAIGCRLTLTELA